MVERGIEKFEISEDFVVRFGYTDTYVRRVGGGEYVNRESH